MRQCGCERSMRGSRSQMASSASAAVVLGRSSIANERCSDGTCACSASGPPPRAGAPADAAFLSGTLAFLSFASFASVALPASDAGGGQMSTSAKSAASSSALGPFDALDRRWKSAATRSNNNRLAPGSRACERGERVARERGGRRRSSTNQSFAQSSKTFTSITISSAMPVSKNTQHTHTHTHTSIGSEKRSGGATATAAPQREENERRKRKTQ